jgi:sortase A
VARLEIPRIGVDEIVVEGVGVDDLRKGPGHYEQTPLPGEHGNAAVAGHRTTYGAPFFDIDQLAQGDEIIVTTYAGRFVYRVTGSTIVSPSEVSVVADTPDDRITLTSCDPKYSASNRIVVTAVLDPNASSPVVAPVAASATTVPATLPGGPSGFRMADGGALPAGTPERVALATQRIADVAPTEPGTVPIDDSIGGGWFDDPAAWPHVIGWGLLGTAVALVAWWLGRLTRRWWLGWLVCSGPFLVLLYFFYENVNRMVPAAL